MSQELRCRCPSCAAKYRFPAEAVGRQARCKFCGVAFRVPIIESESLEDSVVLWLDEAERSQPISNQPRIITAKDVNPEGLPVGPRRHIPLKHPPGQPARKADEK
jgi:hypothetical protein